MEKENSTQLSSEVKCELYSRAIEELMIACYSEHKDRIILEYKHDYNISWLHKKIQDMHKRIEELEYNNKLESDEN